MIAGCGSTLDSSGRSYSPIHWRAGAFGRPYHPIASRLPRARQFPVSHALSLDHIVLAVSELPPARAALEDLLGRSTSWRGRHPSYGTENLLFRLGDAYLELLARDPGSTVESLWTRALEEFLQNSGAGIVMFAFRSENVSDAIRALRARGLAAEDPREGEGADLDTGARRRWINAHVSPESTRGTRSFVIEHRSPPDALPEAPFLVAPSAAIRRVHTVVVESQDVGAARGFWRDAFRLPESQENDHWNYDLGNAVLQLRKAATRCRGLLIAGPASSAVLPTWMPSPCAFVTRTSNSAAPEPRSKVCGVARQFRSLTEDRPERTRWQHRRPAERAPCATQDATPPLLARNRESGMRVTSETIATTTTMTTTLGSLKL